MSDEESGREMSGDEEYLYDDDEEEDEYEEEEDEAGNNNYKETEARFKYIKNSPLSNGIARGDNTYNAAGQDHPFQTGAFQSSPYRGATDDGKREQTDISEKHI